MQKAEFQKCFQGHSYDASLGQCPYCPPVEVWHEKSSNPGDHYSVSTVIINPEDAQVASDQPDDEPDQTKVVSSEPAPVKEDKEPEPPKKLIQVNLTILKGENRGKSIKVQNKAYIGSKETSHILINEADVKSFHGVVSVSDDIVELTDTSGEGIKVNGVKQYDKCVLKHNDRITIGQTVLRVEVNES